MRRTHDPVELIRAANPIPDHDQLLGPTSPEVIFEEIIRMKTDAPTVPATRRRPRSVALVAAAFLGLTATAAATVALNPGGQVAAPAFSGDSWELIVGEGSNGDSGTFKVCHKFVPANEPETMANGLGKAGCSNWPSSSEPDAIIVDAVIALPSDDSVVVFIDLGTVPVAMVVAIPSGGERVEVSPFVMPQSRKQFAVIELPDGTTTVTLEAVGPHDTVLDTEELGLDDSDSS